MHLRNLLPSLFLLISVGLPAQTTITLYTASAGDVGFAWNSRFGGDSYSTGDTTIGTGLALGGSYGNDYTVGIFMIPLAELSGKTVTSATLQVASTGFSTYYYYGSANIGWLDTGTRTLTGDVVADGLGDLAKGRPGGWTIFNSDVSGSELAGLCSTDVSSYIQTDLTAGRAYSVFVLSGSRDTYGGISTAESGNGPRLVVSAIPEPSTYAAIAGLLTLGFALHRRRRA